MWGLLFFEKDDVRLGGGYFFIADGGITKRYTPVETARGYMRGEIDEKVELTDENIEALRGRVGFYEKPDGLTENFTAYLSAYWDARRRLGGGFSDSDQTQLGAGDAGLVDGEPVIGATGRAESSESDATKPGSLIPGSTVFDGENVYMDLSVDFKDGVANDRRSRIADRVSSYVRSQLSKGTGHLDALLGGSADQGDAEVYGRASRRQPSDALRNCLNNLQIDQTRIRRG